MAKRKKPLNVFPVKSVEDANQTLREIAMIEREISAIETRMNENIDKIKAKAKMKAASYEKQLQGLENGLQAFSEFNKPKLFEKKKSMSLNFGSLGFRKNTVLKPMPKFTWAKVLEILKAKGLNSAIRTKETPNKDILGEWSDERLSIVSVRRVSSDQFWYTVNEEELKNE